MQCTQYNTNQSLWSADSRAIIGRMTADIRHLSADGSLVKCHRPPVWRPMISRPSTDIMMKKIFKSRPIIGRPLPARRFTDDKTPENQRIGQRNFNLAASTKSRRPTKKSLKICADVGRHLPIFLFLAHRPSGDRRFG